MVFLHENLLYVQLGLATPQEAVVTEGTRLKSTYSKTMAEIERAVSIQENLTGKAAYTNIM